MISLIINRYADLSLKIKDVSLENFDEDIHAIKLLKAALSKEIAETFCDETGYYLYPCRKKLIGNVM